MLNMTGIHIPVVTVNSFLLMIPARIDSPEESIVLLAFGAILLFLGYLAFLPVIVLLGGFSGCFLLLSIVQSLHFSMPSWGLYVTGAIGFVIVAGICLVLWRLGLFAAGFAMTALVALVSINALKQHGIDFLTTHTLHTLAIIGIGCAAVLVGLLAVKMDWHVIILSTVVFGSCFAIAGVANLTYGCNVLIGPACPKGHLPPAPSNTSDDTPIPPYFTPFPDNYTIIPENYTAIPPAGLLIAAVGKIDTSAVRNPAYILTFGGLTGLFVVGMLFQYLVLARKFPSCYGRGDDEQSDSDLEYGDRPPACQTRPTRPTRRRHSNVQITETTPLTRVRSDSPQPSAPPMPSTTRYWANAENMKM